MDAKAAALSGKYSLLMEYASKYDLPDTTVSKIKAFYENQAKSDFN
jgi:hypothetical protein